MNAAEELVFQLCRQSFLRLWSYASRAERRARNSATRWSLVVIPAVYPPWKEREVRRASPPSPRSPLPQPVPALTSVTNEAD